MCGFIVYAVDSCYHNSDDIILKSVILSAFIILISVGLEKYIRIQTMIYLVNVLLSCQIF